MCHVPEDTDAFMLKSMLHAGIISNSADAIRDLTASENTRIPDDPSTWQVNDEVQILRAIGTPSAQDSEVRIGFTHVWVPGHNFYRFDQDSGRVQVLTPAEQSMSWHERDTVRLDSGLAPLQTPQRQPTVQLQAEAEADDEQDEFESAGSETERPARRQDIGLLASGVYVVGKHQPWMAIIITMRLSKAAQSLNYWLHSC